MSFKVLLLVIASLGLGTLGSAQEPGLVLHLLRGKARDCRLARLVALAVPKGASPSVFLGPGPFSARFEGALDLALRTRLHFSFEGRGWARLSIAGKVVLEAEGEDLSLRKSKALRVRKGENRFLVEYRSPPSAPARLRLFWEGRDFHREPVPPSAFTHQGGAELVEGQLARRGRAVVSARRCLNCHPSRSAEDSPSIPPKFRLGAPSLEGVANRLSPGFLQAWLEDPKALRGDARMPHFLAGPKNSGRRADLVAWLGTLSSPLGDSPAPDPRKASEGGGIYVDLGCVACHRLGQPRDEADDRLSLEAVGAKFRPGALTAFLMAPARLYPKTRMPDFGLSAVEADSLSAFLRTQSRASYPPPLEGNAERGEKEARRLGCVACHEIPGWKTATCAKSLLGGQLIKRDAPCGEAELGLSDGDRAALAALALRPEGLAQRNSGEAAEAMIVELRCTACHAYDRREEAWVSYRSEVAKHGRPHLGPKIMQWRPSLTWLGEKLHCSWTEKRLAGELPKRPRPWLHARMPAFKSRAAELAVGLAERHGLFPGQSGPVEVDDEKASVGRFLIDRRGFGCTACHPLWGREPYAIFEFKAVDFQSVRKRLRREYYFRWMWEPQRIESDSRMPVYADDEGMTSIEDVFDGDAAAQFEAIWDFLISKK